MRLFIYIAILFAGVHAGIQDDISAVSSAASVLASKVSSWNSEMGLFAALRIQRYFPTVSSAVAVLSRNAVSISYSDIDPTNINSFVAAITTLLSALTCLAEDFRAVGVARFVSRNLRQLGQPAADTVDNMFRVVAHDRELIGSLNPSLIEMAEGFSIANDVFGVEQVRFIDFAEFI